ncbi:MAG: PAS domain S-box protein, partial [Deltaproteobacteria bacterium]
MGWGRISKRLSFRVLFPPFCALTLVLITVSLLFFPAFENFIRARVGERVSWESREIFQECDREYSSLLTHGESMDEGAVTIARGRMLGEIFDLARDWGSYVIVEDYLSGKELLRQDLPTDLTLDDLLRLPESRPVFLQGRDGYVALRTRFTPWHWDIVVVKSMREFLPLYRGVAKLFIGAGILIVLSFLLLALVLDSSVRRPIVKIRGALSRGEVPRYRGVYEFEYLSDVLREKISSLSEALSRIDAIVSALPDAVVLVDGEGRVLDARVPKALQDLFPPDTLEAGARFSPGGEGVDDTSLLRETLQGRRGIVRHVEREVEGKRRALEVRTSPVNGEQVLFLIRDVTAQREAERKRKEAEERFRIIIENAIAGTYILQGGKIVYASPEFCRIFGYSEEEILSMDDPGVLVLEEDRDLVNQKIAQRLRGEVDAVRYEFRGVRKDGKVINIEAYGSRAVIGGERCIIGMLLDVTEKKESEKMRREAEERYRSLFMDSLDVIFETTMNGRLVDINPAGLRLFGYESVEEMRRIDVALDLYASPRDREKFLQQLREKGFVFNWEHTLKKKDGTPVHVVVTATLVSGEDGSPRAIRGILRDVTREKSLEKQLLHSQKMEAIGRLAGGIAHDINNYLSAVLGFCEIVRLKYHRDEEIVQQMENAIDSITKASSLIRQLLAFSKRQPAAPRVVDLNGTVRSLAPMMNRLLGDDVELSLSLEEGIPAVFIDPSQMEQVLVNLLVNARDAMPHGGKVTLRTSFLEVEGGAEVRDSLPPGRYVCLSVADTGVGIPEEILDRIFEPFFTTKGKERGSGLGLSTVYGIVEQAGGRIFVQSRVGEGTVFTIYLPASEKKAEEVSSLEASRREERAVSLSGQVVLVDDNDDVRESLETLLSTVGFTVHS